MDVIPQPPSPWDIREADFPREGSEPDRLRFLLRYAVLAPSTRNTQPWRFGIGDHQVAVHLDPSRWNQVADPDRREMYISIGCALENLVIAACHFGYRAAVDYIPPGDDPTLLARVRLLPGGCPEPVVGDPRFEMLTRRSTNHGSYDGRPIDAADLEALAAVVTEPGVRLDWVTSDEGRARVDALMMRADALLLSRPEYRRELGEVIGSGAFGTPWLLATLGRFAVAHLLPASRLAAADHEALMSSPAVGVLGVQAHTREAEMRVGRVLERIYLVATGRGLCLQPVSQLVEVAEVREALQALLPAPDAVPLQPFRVGHAPAPARHTPRRDVDDVLL